MWFQLSTGYFQNEVLLQNVVGWWVPIQQQPVSFCEALAFVSADNLGAQLVGGYKEILSVQVTTYSLIIT